MFLALWLLLVSTPSWAGEEDEAVRAEYVRLSEDLDRLMQKNAWAGVERTFVKVQELGVPIEFDDWVAGAHAARQMGDITAARDRLMRANEIREEREVLDWLWDVDSNYGQVSLRGDPGAVTLAAVQMPFDPLMAKAVQFAEAKVAETGSYDGFLPAGTYAFAGISVKVQPRVTAARIDLRTDEGMAELRRQEKRAEKEERKRKK
ncbi:MAG: hypothetical protein JXX28_02085 [Deltaproteobacteria bacterium]|nr:hypothetical protein [Deltaproteobacteria bacterium]